MSEPATTDSPSTAERANLRAVPVPPQDLLEKIFLGQRQLMERYHEIEEAHGSPVIYEEDEGKIDDRLVQARLHQLYGYMVRELSEAMQELKNKPWKKTQRPTDRQAFVDEVGDTLHFFVEFCITAGIGVEDLADSYFRMHGKNQRRQASEY